MVPREMPGCHVDSVSQGFAPLPFTAVPNQDCDVMVDGVWHDWVLSVSSFFYFPGRYRVEIFFYGQGLEGGAGLRTVLCEVQRTDGG